MTDAGELVHEVDGAVATLDVVDVLKFGDDQVLVFETAARAVAAGDARPRGRRRGRRASRRWRTTPRRTCSTPRCARCSATTSSRRARRCGPTSCASTSRIRSRSRAEERERVERIVNEKVFEAIPVRTFVTPIDEARKLGAMMLFGEKYGEDVRVVEIDGFSRELCGGTHVRSTAEIGPFVILSEGSVGSGARRIEAVTAGEAWAVLHGRSRELERRARRARAGAARGEEAAQGRAEPADVEPEIVVVDGHERDRAWRSTGVGADALLDLSDRFKQRSAPAAVVLGSREDGNVHLVANFDEAVATRISAGDVVKEIAPIVGGGGGGRPTMARAGGKDPERARRRARARPRADRGGARLA